MQELVFAKQMTVNMQLLEEGYPDMHLHVTIHMKLPEDSGVTTELRFEPELPEHLADTFHPQIYNGIHGGLATGNIPLPEGGVWFTVLEFHVMPPLQFVTDEAAIQRIGNIVYDVVSLVVAALWRAYTSNNP